MRTGTGPDTDRDSMTGILQHKTAAIAFEFQIVEEVPAEATDIFPDKVITEKRILL